MSTRPPTILEVFYDAECLICAREIRMVQGWDHSGSMQFTDISGTGFDAEMVGKSQQELMREIHGRWLSVDGTARPSTHWLVGIDVFREMYSRLGFRRSVWLSRVPGVAQLFAFAYHVFAFFRYRFAVRRMGAKIGGGCERGPDTYSHPNSPSVIRGRRQ